MATKKFISFNNLSTFLSNLKDLFATKTEVEAKSDKIHTHSISDVANLQTSLNSKAAQTSLDSHTGNTTTHITSAERANWNTAYTHSQSAHAPSSAEPNQNAFSNVKVGDVTIAADIKTDTLTLVAGNNITLTPDATNDKITISAKDTTYTLGSFGITATATELNKLDGVTVTATEINYIDGVTSNIQTQLDGKAAKSHTHTVANISDLKATATELNYMDGVTSSVQTQLDGKAASGHTHNYAGSSSVGGAATSANKLNTNAGSATQPVYFSNGVPVATTHTLGKSVPSNAVFTDTHYVSKNIVGATNATSNTATALTNGNVYINSVENGAVTSSHKISGSGATTVTTDANGNIIVSSTDNNTTYSAAGSALGLVKSGGDVTISSGVITVNDDSHNHTIANVDNLQAALDGKSSTSHSHETHSQKSMSNTDLNTIKTAGWYYGYTGMTNAPAQSIAVMEVLVYSPDWIVQRFIVVNGAEYIRHWHSGNTWSNWKTNVDSGNVGSQSVNYAATAGSATKATQDASGNVITSTYATKAELDTAKSTLQTSINGKANSSHTHTIANITNLQTTLDGKAASSHNHAASNITSGTLSSDRLPTVPIAKGGTGATTAAGALTNLGITATATELNYVDGVTSNIQTQLNGKSGTSHTHSYLPLSGGTITGQLDADKVFRNGNTFYNVLEFASTATVDEIVIKTKIPFISGNSMPLVHLKGYAYGESATIEMTVAFYIYNDKFTNMGVVSSCPWKPSVYLSSYTENNTKYIAISFSGSIYYPRFVVDYTDIWSGSSNRDYSSGWASSNRASGGTTSIIPSTDKVEVPYKPIANNISGNASTATNVAWSGVTSKPSYYDAKAIKSITRNGTTFTYTCMDGTTGTFTQQDNNTDTKVTNTLATTTKAYVTGTTSASTNTGTQVFDTGVYLDTTAGQLTATTFNGTTFKGSGVATLAEAKSYLGI